MAYQRPFLISMKKTDPQQPWGFRTFGGKDYGEPHAVERVLDGSNAERCGLRQGDEIIQIGRNNVQDMTFGQVQEILARCGNKIEMFIIREDLLSPRKGKEPPFVKAVVHNPYNSPLNLYSTENIADTLAKQTEVLTEGHISSAEEEEGPENLSFKQKSAVFQLLEEQARQEGSNQSYSKGDYQKKTAPPPPPKPKPPASQDYHNKENYYPEDTYQSQPQSNRPTNALQDSSHINSYRKTEQQITTHSVQAPVTNNYTGQQYNTTTHKSTYKVAATQPSKSVSSEQQETMTTAYKPQQYQEETYYQRQWQQQQEAQQRQMTPQQRQVASQKHHATSQQHQVAPQQHQVAPQQHHVAPQQHHVGPQQHQVGPQQHHVAPQQHHVAHQQHHVTSQKHQFASPQHQVAPQQYQQNFPPYHQPHYQSPVTQIHQQKQNVSHQYQPAKMPQSPPPQVESIFEDAPQSAGTPIIYKAPPSQKHKVNWPPQSPVQQNGRWSSPSPTPASPSRSNIEAIWPPKQPTARDLPKTGFNPVVLREQGTGRRCVWPPPKTDDEFRSGRTTPQSPISGRRIVFNPSPSPPTARRTPFGSMSPVSRRKDISWPPPPPPAVTKTETFHQKPSPTFTRKARFDDYVKQHAGINVPSTYRPPPGTQHVEYC